MTLPDLIKAIDASIQQVDRALDVAAGVEPKGHRVEMTKSQLEAAREVLVKARGFSSAKATGTFAPVTLPKKP